MTWGKELGDGRFGIHLIALFGWFLGEKRLGRHVFLGCELSMLELFDF
jgi:hypothetical protein